MNNLRLTTLICLVALCSAVAGCGRGKPEAQKQAQTPSPGAEVAPGTGANAVAGIHWIVPSRWREHPPRSMRVATYVIPAAAGDSEAAECGVYYFGRGEGGDVRSNIDRWVGQFADAGKPEESSKVVNGIEVTTVTLSGTYLQPGGPDMTPRGSKANYRLLGAIVSAPDGSVFFKLTGPAKTVSSAAAEFDAMIASLNTKTPA